jgi:PAS domain S-box-containing protein
MKAAVPLDTAARAESDGLHAALFAVSPHLMWVCDFDTLAIVAVSEGAVREYGYSREEFLGMTMDALHQPDDVLDIRHMLAVTAGRPGAAIPCRHRKKNGVTIPVELVASAGRFLGKRLALVMATDISQDQGPELLYRSVLDSIPLSVLLIDRGLRVVEANRNFLERARRTKATTLGRPLNEVFPSVILEGLPLLRQIERVFGSGQALEGQRLSYRAPGVPLRTYYYGIVPITAGTSTGLVMLEMQDVTEQLRLGEEVRRVERHLASVAESASEILVSIDVSGRILTWNKAAERISGYRLSDLQGGLLFDYCAEECRQSMRLLLADPATLGSALEVEYALVTRSGARIPVSWAFSPMKDDLGRMAGVVAVGRDLTERRKLEQQLLQSQKLAALGVMAGGIAHEIRTPLAIASSAAQFLMEPDITEEFRQECAEKVHLGIHRVSGIIENLLRFAHPSSKPAMAEFDLLKSLREAIALIANQARIQKVEIAWHLPEGQLRLCGIAGLIEQVFLNLFLNALTAMPGGGRLTVSGSRSPATVTVRVSDTGCGIAEADIYNIFDPFYTTAQVGKGTGLGLSVCYSIVADHGGSIEVESIPNQGSTFTVQLPARGKGNADAGAGSKTVVPHRR